MDADRSTTFPDAVITTPRLTLRPLRASDVDAVQAAASDALTQQWLPLPRPYRREDAEHWCMKLAPAQRTSGRGLVRAVDRDGLLVGLRHSVRFRSMAGWPGRRAMCTTRGWTW